MELIRSILFQWIEALDSRSYWISNSWFPPLTVPSLLAHTTYQVPAVLLLTVLCHSLTVPQHCLMPLASSSKPNSVPNSWSSWRVSWLCHSCGCGHGRAMVSHFPYTHFLTGWGSNWPPFDQKSEALTSRPQLPQYHFTVSYYGYSAFHTLAHWII